MFSSGSCGWLLVWGQPLPLASRHTISLHITSDDDHLGITWRHVELVTHVRHSQDILQLMLMNKWLEYLLTVKSFVGHLLFEGELAVLVVDVDESVAFGGLLLLVNLDIGRPFIAHIRLNDSIRELSDLVCEGSLEHLGY